MNELLNTALPKRKKWALGLAVAILAAIVVHLVFFAEFYGTKSLSHDNKPLVIQHVENNVNIEKQVVIHGAKPNLVPEVTVLNDGYGAAQQALNKARNTHTIAAYEQYLTEFPKSPWKHKAEYYRDKLEAEALREENSIAAYNAFLKQRPDSDWFNHVRHFRDRAEYKKAKKADSSMVMQQFIDKYPKSNYRKKAEDVMRRLKKLGK